MASTDFANTQRSSFGGTRLIKADPLADTKDLEKLGYKFIPKLNSWYVPKEKVPPKSTPEPPPAKSIKPTVPPAQQPVAEPEFVPQKKTGPHYIYSDDPLATDYTKPDLFTMNNNSSKSWVHVLGSSHPLGGERDLWSLSEASVAERNERSVKEQWDSVERYLMWMLYKNTVKGAEIKNAATLAEARRIFNIKSLPPANSPKQLIQNQKLGPIANSAKNPDFYKDFDSLFFKATLAKINQNSLLKSKLLLLDGQIVSKDIHDRFGYVGNLLGNVLMSIRDGHTELQRGEPTNNLVIEKYSPELYVIRGNPTVEMASSIRTLGSFKTKSGTIVKGKHSLLLQPTASWGYGGDGWLIPKAQGRAAKDLLLETFPEHHQIGQILLKWIRQQIKMYTLPALEFSKIVGHQEIDVSDMKKSICEFFGKNIDNLFEPSTAVPLDFIEFTVKVGKNVSEPTIKLLWNFISKEYADLFGEKRTVEDSSGCFVPDVKSSKKLQTIKETLANVDMAIFEMDVPAIQNLTVRETIVVQPFCRIFKLLRRESSKLAVDESHLAMSAITIITNSHTFNEIRKLYGEKVKLPAGDKKKTDDFEMQLIHRFKIKTPHISTILGILPQQLSKKSKLLVFTMIDYLCQMNIVENQIETDKKLIVMAQIPMPEPSPIPETHDDFDLFNDHKKHATPSPKTKETPTPSVKSKKTESPSPKDRTPTPKPKSQKEPSPSPKPKSRKEPTPSPKKEKRPSRAMKKIDVDQDSPTLEELMKRF